MSYIKRIIEELNDEINQAKLMQEDDLLDYIEHRDFSDEVLNQSAIPIHIRVAMSEEVGKARKRENLKSSLFLSNKERENKNEEN